MYLIYLVQKIDLSVWSHLIIKMLHSTIMGKLPRFSSSLSIFSLLSKTESTPYKPSRREAQQYQIQNENSWILFPWVLELGTEEDILAPKKERISISLCRYLIDPRNLANYNKDPSV